MEPSGSLENDDSPLNIERLPPSEPSVDVAAPLTSYSIGFNTLNATSFTSQLEALQNLSSYPETVDLVLTTADGTIEPVHTFYLAFKAPKFWAQQIAPKVGRIKMTKQYSADDVHQLRTSEGIIVQAPKVLIANTSGEMLHVIISSIYQRKDVKLDCNLSWVILAIAKDLELDFLVKKCLSYLSGTLGPENCVQLMQVGLQFGHRLANTAYHFLLQHFQMMLNRSELFHRLTVAQLTTILSDDHLNIGNELYAFEAVILWTAHLPTKRLSHFWSLFLQVRTQVMHSGMRPLMMNAFLKMIEGNDGNAVFSALKSSLSTVQWPLAVFNPRVPRTIAFIYGGFEDGLPSAALKTFDPRSGRCFSITLPDAPVRVHHATVALGRKLFFIGGSDGFELLTSLTCLNLITARFRELAPMAEPRSAPSAVVLCRSQSIMVMGGSNSTGGSLRSCELYDSQRNAWHPLPPMNSARREAASAVFGDKVYIAGGVDSFCSASVEVYSITGNYWTVVSFMNVPRRGHALLSTGNALFAIGGCSDTYEYTW